MSCFLPPEILDIVVDHLHEDPVTLKKCCVVSKSWVPRTRRHIFERVNFSARRPSPAMWAMKFPDPSNSPAHYTRTLTFAGINNIAADADVCRWIRAFHNVVHLRVTMAVGDWVVCGQMTLVPFYGLSPAVRSIYLECVYAPPSEVFDLLWSFPLLRDIELISCNLVSGAGTWTTPLTSPPLTGSLELHGWLAIVPRFLDLPNGLNFTKITSGCSTGADFKLGMDLVSACSGTLEYLNIVDCFPGVFPSALVSGPYITATFSPGHSLV